MLENVNFTAFKAPITFSLVNNITKQTCSTLSNILAIDYATRLNSQPIITEYVQACIAKLKNFLGYRVITDDSFSTAMSLFVVAISEESFSYEDKNNLIQQTQDAVINMLINQYFVDSSIEDKRKIQSIMKDLLNSENINNILNQINADPKFIKTIIHSALQIYTRQTEINNYVKTSIKDVLDKSIKLEKKINFIKESASKIITGVCALTLGALSIMTAGVALSVVIVPASILTMQYAPKLGEKIGTKISNLGSSIAEQKRQIYVSKVLAIQDTKDSIERIELRKAQNIQRSHINNANNIKEKLSAYINDEVNEQQAAVRIKKGIGRTI